MTYNDTFQDRIANAARAREDALAKLKARPAADPKAVAERVERQKQRDASKKEKAEAKRIAKAAQAAEKAAKAIVPAAPTPEEAKAARDMRYAARKARR